MGNGGVLKMNNEILPTTLISQNTPARVIFSSWVKMGIVYFDPYQGSFLCMGQECVIGS